MTLRPALARLGRGFRRMWASAAEWLWERPRAALAGVPWVRWRAQRAQARETEVSLGLMEATEAAGADMTPEQQIFLSQSEHGMRERLSVLLGIPHRSLAQEREKRAIEGWLARGSLDQVEPSLGKVRPLLGAAPALGLLGGVRLWMVFGVAAAAALALWQLDGARLRYDRDRECRDSETRRGANTTRRACITLGETQRALADAHAIQERLVAEVRAADELSRQTAANLEAERQRAEALRRRQRERAREAQEVLTRNQPPAWDDRLRDLGAEAGAGDHRATGRDPG